MGTANTESGRTLSVWEMSTTSTIRRIQPRDLLGQLQGSPATETSGFNVDFQGHALILSSENSAACDARHGLARPPGPRLCSSNVAAEVPCSPTGTTTPSCGRTKAQPAVLKPHNGLKSQEGSGVLRRVVGTPDTNGRLFMVNCPVPAVAPVAGRGGACTPLCCVLTVRRSAFRKNPREPMNYPHTVSCRNGCRLANGHGAGCA